MKKQRVLLSWSGGKDSAVALFELKSPEYKIDALLTTYTDATKRVPIHEIPLELIERQAESLEMPLIRVEIPDAASNSIYEQRISEVVLPLKKKGLQGVAFGDLFLEDIKNYRDQFFSKLELETVYPIWKWKQQELLRVFFGLGFKAIVVSVDLKKLPLSFVGRPFDRDFVDSLPSNVDPCGENGEFHTFVFDGPFFQRKVVFQTGEPKEKNGMGFIELRP